MGEDLLQTATVDLRSLWIERVGPLDETSVVDVADVLLMDLVSRRTSGITVVPTGPRHEISYVDADVQGSIRSDLADAVVARFGLIADLDVAGSLPQLGRIRARASSEQTKAVTEVLVAIRPTPAGLAAELRLLADPVSMGDPDPDPEKVVAEGVQVGKYRLLQKIGTGGMGTVYRAEHVILQKPVAIKVLHGGAGAAFSDSQFLVEARAPCLVRHPSVVDVTDFGRLADGRSFVVMELVELPTLAQVLARSGSLSPQRAVTLASRIAEALSVLHAHGVLHRDLKPANVFVDDDDAIKLCDFRGLHHRPAKRRDRSARGVDGDLGDPRLHVSRAGCGALGCAQ